jgi:hypothetical protein
MADPPPTSSSSSSSPSSSPAASPPFTSSFSAAVSSAVQLQESRLVDLVTGYADSFECEMAALLCSHVLPSPSPAHTIAIAEEEGRWSASVRWHWLTFRDYFGSGDDSYRASKAFAYQQEGDDGPWQEKADACSDVHTALAQVEAWWRRQTGVGGGEAEEVRVTKATWQLVNEWAEAQRKSLTFPCWVALLGVNLQFLGPLDFVLHQNDREVPPQGRQRDDRPRRAKSAFILFSNDHRQQVKEEQPEMKFGEIARELAERWRTAAPEVKAVYERRAAADVARYEADVQRFEQRHGVVRPNRKKRKQWDKDFDSHKEEEKDEEDGDDDD